MICERLANLLTFWIPVSSLRRSIRSWLKGGCSVFHIQNVLIHRYDKETSSLIIFLIPEFDVMSGGIYSMFSIANISEKFENIHDSRVIIATRPNKKKETIIFNTNFRNDNLIFRFEQITYFKNLTKLILNIPEESCSNFYKLLSPKLIKFLKEIRDFQINILNQNIELMPKKEELKDLYKLTNNITQTTAHHRYCSQEIANRYNLPTSLIPPYTDIRRYQKINFEQKENIILYSPDKISQKNQILETLSKNFPGYKLIQIKDMKFDKYMDLIKRAKYMITFGEGYDGYLAQSMLMNGIGFAVYKKNFFPEEYIFDKPNIFKSFDEMQENITERIKYFEENETARKETIEYFNSIQNSLYNFDNYIDCIEKFYKKQYDYLPQNQI